MNIQTALLRLAFLTSTSCAMWIILSQLLPSLSRRSNSGFPTAAAFSLVIAALVAVLLVRGGLLVSPRVAPAAIFKTLFKALFASLAKLVLLIAAVFLIALLAGKSPPKDAALLSSLIAIFISIPLAMPFAVVATGRKLMTSAQSVSSQGE